MVGAQLDVIDQDIFFIRPDTLQQLVPSLNQYFKYAELLVSGNVNRSGPVPRPQMNSAPNMAQQRLINGQIQNNSQIGMQPNNGSQAKNSPLMSPAMMTNSPNFRPNTISPHLRGAAPQQMNSHLAQNLQALNQQISMYQAKNNQLQQSLMQIQSMRQNQAMTQDQQQNLQYQQQEMMKQQQSVASALNQLTQQYRAAMDQMKNFNALANQQRAINNQQQMAQIQSQIGRGMAPNMNMMNPMMGVNPSFQNNLQNSPQLQESNLPANMDLVNGSMIREANNFGTSPPSQISHIPYPNIQNGGDTLVTDFRKPSSPLVGAGFEQKQYPAQETASAQNLAMENFGFGSDSFMNTFHQQKGQSRPETSPKVEPQVPAAISTAEPIAEKLSEPWDEQLNFGNDEVKPSANEEG